MQKVNSSVIFLKITLKNEGRENCNTQTIRYRCFLSDLTGFAGLVVQYPAIIKKMAERVGFEPTVGVKPTHNFQSCSFGLSDTSPFKRSKRKYGGEIGIRTPGTP